MDDTRRGGQIVPYCLECCVMVKREFARNDNRSRHVEHSEVDDGTAFENSNGRGGWQGPLGEALNAQVAFLELGGCNKNKQLYMLDVVNKASVCFVPFYQCLHICSMWERVRRIAALMDNGIGPLVAGEMDFVVIVPISWQDGVLRLHLGGVDGARVASIDVLLPYRPEVPILADAPGFTPKVDGTGYNPLVRVEEIAGVRSYMEAARTR